MTIATTGTTLTGHEAAQVERANASGRREGARVRQAVHMSATGASGLAGARGSRRGLRDFQEALNDAGGTLPLRLLRLQLITPRSRERVDPHATAALGLAPFG